MTEHGKRNGKLNYVKDCDCIKHLSISYYYITQELGLGLAPKHSEKIEVIRCPQKITHRKLYEITKTVPLSITITERRWKFLGHILKKNNEILFLKNIHQEV